MTRTNLDKLGGADNVVQNQGLYLYREKRLIIAGGWLGMAQRSQLGKLARVQVDIPSSLDDEWSTDVKKSNIQIPNKVKRGLKKFLSDPVKRSNKVHRHKGRIDSANPFWTILEDDNNNSISYIIDTSHNVLSELIANLDRRDGQILLTYLGHLSENLPINHIYEKMSSRPKDISLTGPDSHIIEALLDKLGHIK
ncbi:MAG TPA: hypothetical protein EYQ00_00570 [Dehalococcoidia bacterium]|nr:hypothetical protein [Dehalococcoidia bacterium]